MRYFIYFLHSKDLWDDIYQNSIVSEFNLIIISQHWADFVTFHINNVGARRSALRCFYTTFIMQIQKTLL
jgi:hypothetical protein